MKKMEKMEKIVILLLKLTSKDLYLSCSYTGENILRKCLIPSLSKSLLSNKYSLLQSKDPILSFKYKKHLNKCRFVL